MTNWAIRSMGSNGKRLLRAIPAGDHQFSLIVGINKSDQVAEHDAVFMTETGNGAGLKRHSRDRRVDRKSGFDVLGFARPEDERFIYHGTKI